MKNRKESLEQLRKSLPHGSFQKIRKRLMNKGIRFSLQYISRCLDPDHSDYNLIILEEAIMMGEENTLQIKELCQRIGHLDKTI